MRLQPHLGSAGRGVLAPIGVVLPMAIGALLMSASAVVVALNPQFLQRLDLRPATSAAAVLSRRGAEQRERVAA